MSRKRKKNRNKIQTIEQRESRWKYLCGLLCTGAFGFALWSLSDREPPKVVHPQTQPISLEKTLERDFQNARMEPDRFAQTFLDHVFSQKENISEPYEDLGSLTYQQNPLRRSYDPYNISAKDEEVFLALMSTQVHGAGVRPSVLVHKQSFELCTTLDEFYSLLDNEVYICKVHMGKVRIRGENAEKLNIDAVSNETKTIIHEALSSKYQCQLIRKGERNVGERFKKEMENTYSFLRFKLIQIHNLLPDQREEVTKWLPVFADAKYDHEMAKRMGLNITPTP